MIAPHPGLRPRRSFPARLFPAAVAVTAGLALAGCRPTDASSHSAPATPNQVATVSAFPVPSTPAATAGAPDQAAIQSVMTRTVEVADPSEHFAPTGRPVTAPDRNAGTLTAVIGQRTPAADGHGQLVFFWQNGRFVGWDAETEAMSITKITGGTGYFQVTYTHYAASDPACCASLPPVTIAYVWQDDGFVPSGGTRPTYGNPVRVKLNP